jgi:chemotaxis protein MotB
VAELLRKKPQVEEVAEGAPGWMVTFADLMTLLLTFFIMLVAMSTMQEDRIKVALGSLRGALGVLEGGGKTVKGRAELVALRELHADVKATPTNINRAVDEELAKYSSNQHIQIAHAKDSVRIVLDDGLLFGEGSSEIQPGAYGFLSDLAMVIADTKCVVEFHGHTDDVGTGDSRLNWDVGAQRAISVLEYVSQSNEVDTRRLRAVSYGEMRPLAPNNSPANRRRNRRVEIVMTTSSRDAIDAVESMSWAGEAR